MTNARRSLLLLETNIPDLEAARSTARHIVRDAQRAAHVIVRVRKLFTRKSGLNEPLDLNSAIHEAIILVRDEIYSGGVTLRLELASDLPEVAGDRRQLQQVVLNLITNAVQAMSSVDTRPRELSFEHKLITLLKCWSPSRDSGVA